MKFSFIGDISLNDEYVTGITNGIDYFSEISLLLAQSDLVIGNLECLIKGDNGENLKKKPRLKTTTDTLHILKKLNVKVVTLAHNHIYDNLEDGFEKTIDFLRQNDIGYLGAGFTQEEAATPYFLQDHKICLLNYVTRDTNPGLPEEAGIKLNYFEKEKAIGDIDRYKSDYTIVILMHWGGRFEGGLFPDRNQPVIAKELIDAGAALIMGNHSHTLQPVEKYNSTYIFYSLGNFCFSPIYSDGNVKYFDRKRYKRSLVVNLTFSEGNEITAIDYLPVRNVNLHIKPGPTSDLIKFRSRSGCYNLLLKNKIGWLMYAFYYRKIDPVMYQLFRKDPEKSFIYRIKNLNLRKFRQLFSK